MSTRSLRQTRVTLVTGASGYIGRHLRERLEARGHPIRCVSRHPERLTAGPKSEVVYGDMHEPGSLPPAFRNVDTAYYLVHSMGGVGNFIEQDRLAARNFARAARLAGVSRIIYLGGLGSDEELSDHLESRQEVGQILAESGVPTLEFRASIIIGAGSLSFEIVRALVDKLPIMITPRWVRRRAQPIAIDDVVAYLLAALEERWTSSAVFEIGGATQATYAEIMMAYADRRGLPRFMIPVPVLTPRLSSLWLGLVTPAEARVGRKLVESLRNDTVVSDAAALRAFPVHPMDLPAAIDRAITVEDAGFRRRHWSASMDREILGETHETRLVGRRIVDSRSVEVSVSAREAFRPIRKIGGRAGWYAADWLWRLRGFLDSLIGGPGLRRGRRDPERIRVDDRVDSWRVEAVDDDRRLRLRAEMKIPGRAWLQFEVNPCPYGTRIRQTAEFDPSGLAGLLYWYTLYPVHQWLFRRMLRRIADLASGPVPDAEAGEQGDLRPHEEPAPERRPVSGRSGRKLKAHGSR